MPDSFPPDTPASSPELGHSEDEHPSLDEPLREGLPTTYRMRHDRHYLDELEARSPGVLIRMLRMSDIHVARPRRDVVAPLVESVRQVGVLQPVLVRRRESTYELIAGAGRVAAASAAGLTEVPCRVYEVDDDGARVLAEADDLRWPSGDSEGGPRLGAPTATSIPILGELGDSLRAASACLGLSREAADRPYNPVVREVTRVELQRAVWLVEGLQVLCGRPVHATRAMTIGSVLERAFELTRTERRLTSISLSSNLEDEAVVLRADETLLVMAFGALMAGLMAMVRSSASPSIGCTVSASNSEALVEMSQSCVGVSSDFISRFSDPSFDTRSGGHIAAVNAASATRVVELHGGRVTPASLQPLGFKVSVTLPSLARRSS